MQWMAMMENLQATPLVEKRISRMPRRLWRARTLLYCENSELAGT
jgi:hypothetical protein